MGVTSEALREVIRFLFAEVGMLRVDAMHDARNPHSCLLYTSRCV